MPPFNTSYHGTIIPAIPCHHPHSRCHLTDSHPSRSTSTRTLPQRHNRPSLTGIRSLRRIRPIVVGTNMPLTALPTRTGNLSLMLLPRTEARSIHHKRTQMAITITLRTISPSAVPTPMQRSSQMLPLAWIPRDSLGAAKAVESRWTNMSIPMGEYQPMEQGQVEARPRTLRNNIRMRKTIRGTAKTKIPRPHRPMYIHRIDIHISSRSSWVSVDCLLCPTD